MEKRRDDVSGDGKIHMVETRLYIGLNDAETKKQIFETEQYAEQLKKLCLTYHVPFLVAFEEGGYPNSLSDFEAGNGNGLDFSLIIYIKLRE